VLINKDKICIRAKWPVGSKLIGIFLLPLDGMLVHRRVTPGIKFATTHLYTWVERGTVGVKCLTQEHNTMSPARVRDHTTRAGVERTARRASVNKGFLICNF